MISKERGIKGGRIEGTGVAHALVGGGSGGLHVEVSLMMKMTAGWGGGGGGFQPHTADQKPRRDIINSWIFCVFHLTAGRR